MENKRLSLEIDSGNSKTQVRDVVSSLKNLTKTSLSVESGIEKLNQKLKATTGILRTLDKQISRSKLPDLSRKLKEVDVAVKGLNTRLLKTSKRLGDVSKSTKGFKNMVGDTKGSLESLVREVKGLDNSLKTTRDGMRSTGKETQRASGHINAFGSILGSLGIGFLTVELGRTTDAYKAMSNQLIVVTGDTENTSYRMQQLAEVSRKSRTSLEATTDVYSKLNRVNARYGYSMNELLEITTTVSQAVSMSGATAQGAAGAMIQFSQALSGDFQAAAQELNSIIEQTQGLADAVAQGLNTTGKFAGITTDQLKKLAKEGKLRTKDVLEGLMNVSAQVNERFQKSQLLLSQGWQALKDSLTLYVGEIDKSTGISAKMADGMMWLAENLQRFDREIRAVALFIGTAFVAAIAVATKVFLGFVAAFLGLPVLIAAVIGGIVALAWYFQNDLANAIDEAWLKIKEFFLITRPEFMYTDVDWSALFEGLTGELSANLDIIAGFFKKWYDTAILFVSDLFTEIDEAFTGSTLEAMLNLSLLKIKKYFAELHSAASFFWIDIQSGAENAINNILKFFAEGINHLISAYNKIPLVTDIDAIDLSKKFVDFTSDNQDDYKKHADNIAAIEREIAAATETLKKKVEVNKQALNTDREQVEVRKQLRAEQEKEHQAEIAEMIEKIKAMDALRKFNAEQEKSKPSPEDIKRIKKIREEYQSLMETVDTNVKVSRELSKAWETLNAYGELTGQSAETIQKNFVKVAQEITGVNDEIQKSNDFLKELTNSMDASAEITEKMEEAERHLNVQLSLGNITLPEKIELLRKYREELDGTSAKTREAADAFADTFMEGIEAAMEGLDNFKDWFKDLLKNLALTALKNRVIIPFSYQTFGLGSEGQTIAGQAAGFNPMNMLSGGMDVAKNALQYFGGNVSGYTGFAYSGLGQSLGLSAPTQMVVNTELMGLGITDDALINQAVPELTQFGEIVGEALGMIGAGLTAYGVAGEYGPVAGTLAGVGSLATGATITSLMGGASFGASLGAGAAMLTNPVGWVIAGLGAVLGSLNKPSDKLQTSSIDLASGQTFQGGFDGEKFSQENRDFADALAGTISIMSNFFQGKTGLSPEGGIDLLIGNRDGLRLQYNGELVLHSKDSEEFVKKAEDFVAELYGIDLTVYRELAHESESTLAAMLRLEQQLAAVKDAANLTGNTFSYTGDDAITYANTIASAAGGLDAFMAGLSRFNQETSLNTEGLAFLAQTEKLSGVFRSIGVNELPTTVQGFQDLVQSLDLSTDYGRQMYGVLMSLAPAFFDFANSLENLMNIVTPLTNLSQSIREQMMSEEELYLHRKKQAEELAVQIQTMTDPTEIKNAVDRINQLTSNAWSSLDETQQAAMGDQFLTFLDEVTTMATDRLEDLVGESIDTGALEYEASAEEVTALQQTAAKDMTAAATELATASGALQSSAAEISQAASDMSRAISAIESVANNSEREVDYR